MIPVSSVKQPIFVYVLCCRGRDQYFDTSCVSIHSARLANPGARLAVVLSKTTESSLGSHCDLLRREVDDFIVHETEFEGAEQESREIKTSLTEILRRDFIFFDSDILHVKKFDFSPNPKSLSTVYCAKEPMWFVGKIAPHKHADLLVDLGLEVPSVSSRRNTGVYFVKDSSSSRSFFRDWHNVWKLQVTRHGVAKDQSLFNAIAPRHPGVVDSLPLRFNAPIANLPFLMYGASLWHYWISTGGVFDATALGILTRKFRETDRFDKDLYRKLARRGNAYPGKTGILRIELSKMHFGNVIECISSRISEKNRPKSHGGSR